MNHENRQAGVRNKMSRDPANQAFPEAPTAVATDNKQVRPGFHGCRQQRLADALGAWVY
jgi:hypothetical protein